jgi:flagellar basal-body rod protein FlgC
MSDIKNIFDIAWRGMSAQMLRLNTVASNLANARSVASSEAEAYRAIKPVFSTLYADDLEKSGVASVDVVDIVLSIDNLTKFISQDIRKLMKMGTFTWQQSMPRRNGRDAGSISAIRK